MRASPTLMVAAKAAALPLGLLSRRKASDLTLLLYHRVGVGDREIDVPLRTFEDQMEFLSDTGRVLSLHDALAFDGPGGVVVTVDDGYGDFRDHVMPILVRLGIPVVLYLATGLVARDPRRGSGHDLTWEQLGEAVSTGLVTVGSHTHSHADLSRASEREAEEEMRRSRDLIEDRLGVPCRHFAYPWSIGSPDADRATRRLFDTAAIEWGTNRRPIRDPHRLGRLPVMRSDGLAFFRAKVAGWLDGEAFVYRGLRRGPWRSR